MKKKSIIFTFVILFLLSSIFLYLSVKKIIFKLASPIPSISPISSEVFPTESPAMEIFINEKKYQYYFHKIANNETIELVPNFENSTFSAQIMKSYNCVFGINGGFYKKEGGPLGLFQIGSKKIGNQIQSMTFNGYLVSSSGLSIFSTSSYQPRLLSDLSDFILQTGPLIFLKNQIQPSFIEEDFARRHLIAKTTTNDFYLFSIFEKDNVLLGPRLKDLRDIFLSKEIVSLADFDMILNLDGGSASAFYDNNIQVEEFKPIGSFLCGKRNNSL